MRTDDHMRRDADLVMAENRTSAARMMLTSKMDAYLAIISVGSPKARERARNEVMYATEALLDLQEELMCVILRNQGIDPLSRNDR